MRITPDGVYHLLPVSFPVLPLVYLCSTRYHNRIDEPEGILQVHPVRAANHREWVVSVRQEESQFHSTLTSSVQE